MSYREHSTLAGFAPVRCAVITVSDTRDEATDQSGAFIRERLSAAGHQLSGYNIVPDDPARVVAALGAYLPVSDAVLLTGGTGISARDNTFEAVSSRLGKTLPGFGELFRMLSYQEIGSGSMLSRAAAGVCEGVLVFSMPGSLNAVTLAMEKLILPELAHLVWELRRQAAPPPGG